MSKCLPCAEQFHDFCTAPPVGLLCCCEVKQEVKVEVIESNSEVNTGARDGMIWSKDDKDIKNQKSTGRKRAATLFPLDKEADCEWKMLKYAGGGLIPIVGCHDNKQDNRHHGPILLTLANFEGNVHRICSDCHNRFHTLNDPFVKDYMRTVMWRPHDAKTKISPEEFAQVILQGHTEYAKARVLWRPYDKKKHAFNEVLDELQHSGEIANEWIGF